jgi:hypothetical protein
VGLSLSGATDIANWGASSEHLATLADDLVTMLLFAGVRLAYGGVLAHGGAKNDETNYTRRLFGLVRSYSPLAESLGVTAIHPIVNFVPWPTHFGYTEAELDVYGQEAELEAGPAPAVDRAAIAALKPNAAGFFSRNNAPRSWAYARGATEMRRAMAAKIDARIALAGKLEGYSGLLPGVIEEVLVTRSTSPSTPLFLIGVFGGASRYAIDLLEQRPRPEATTSWVTKNVVGYEALVAEYQQRGDPLQTPEGAAAELRRLGTTGIAKALQNGLDDAENRELFTSSNAQRIVELILVGLRRRFSQSTVAV